MAEPAASPSQPDARLAELNRLLTGDTAPAGRPKAPTAESELEDGWLTGALEAPTVDLIARAQQSTD
eukprot:8216671-Alexandrium_andersonii.AAC.1